MLGRNQTSTTQFCWVVAGMMFWAAEASAQSVPASVSVTTDTTAKGQASLLTPVPTSAVFVVAPGQSKTFKLASEIEGMNIPNRTVCNVVPAGDHGVILTGLKLGKTQFTVWGPKSLIETFTVHVLPDRQTVLAELLSKYPNSNLQLIPSPESGKVIAKGMLPSTGAVHDVLEHLEGPDLSRSQIINRLAVPYCSSPCYRVRRFSLRCR